MHLPFSSATSVVLEHTVLEQDYRDAIRIDQAALGKLCFYCPGLLKLRYLPYDTIQWAYLRAEESHVTMCCGKGYMDIWYLILYAEGKQAAKLEFQQKETAKEAFALLTERAPHMLTGYTEDARQAFAQLTSQAQTSRQ